MSTTINPPSASATASQTIIPALSQTTGTTSQRQPGQAKGSLGYSASDCIALVAEFQECLPLGTQEQGYVQEKYNQYATENNQPTSEVNPVKSKFWVLATHTKPTGDSDCLPYMHEARLVQIKWIHARMSLLVTTLISIKRSEFLFVSHVLHCNLC